MKLKWGFFFCLFVGFLPILMAQNCDIYAITSKSLIQAGSYHTDYLRTLKGVTVNCTNSDPSQIKIIGFELVIVDKYGNSVYIENHRNNLFSTKAIERGFLKLKSGYTIYIDAIKVKTQGDRAGRSFQSMIFKCL